MPPQKKIVAIISLVVIVLATMFLISRCKPPVDVRPQYTTNSLDEGVGYVAGEEAIRVARGQTNIVVLLNAHEADKGNSLQIGAQNYLMGLQGATMDEKGNSRPDVKILGRKYRSDDPTGSNVFWPPSSVLQNIPKEFPECNVIISFCGRPAIGPQDRGAYNPSEIPRMIVIDELPDTPDKWQTVFQTGLVEVLFAAHNPPPGQFTTKTTRELVESRYYILTLQNLTEVIRKASGQ